MRPGTFAIVFAAAVAPAVAAAVLAAAVAPARAEEPALPPGLYEACVQELPKALAEAEAQAGAGPRAAAQGPAGAWSVVLHDLDGNGTSEAFLTALPAGRGGEVTFLYRKDGEGGDWASKDVKLEGGPVTEVRVDALPVGDGRSLAHVHAGPGGQALLHWSGGKLETVWKTGKPREGERRWTVLEDLNGDGTAEVVEYFQREMDDFFADEDDLEDNAAGGATTRVDAVAVHRLDGDRWKKDRDLLESRRRR
jgi:hypothetical protein